MRVLVTGHHGYIGSVLVPLVRSAGHDVVGLDSYLFRGSLFGDELPPVVMILRASRCSCDCLSTRVICSTAVVRNSVSPPPPLILVICAFMSVAGNLTPQLVLASVMIFLGVLTNFVSNNAAAAIGTPVALSIAQQIGAPPEPFILAAIVGCNLSFATPMGYQTNVLIMQPGGYVFRDFVRVGGPLVILMIVAFSFQLARAYPI